MKQAFTYQNVKKAVTDSFYETVSSPLGKIALLSPVAFCSAPSSFAESSSVVTGDMLAPLVKIISDNIAAILPIGITIMGAIIGVSMIPRIIYKFL